MTRREHDRTLDVAAPGTATATFEVRYAALNGGAGLAFPCSADGLVDVDRLTDRGRANYLRASSLVGRDYCAPEVCSASRDEPL
jgi:hypothetical protein